MNAALIESVAPMGVHSFHASLPIPPGFNESYHGNRDGSVRLSERAKAWKTATRLYLGQWKPLPPGDYVLTVEYDLYCWMGRDIDGIVKLLIDACVEPLCVNDNRVMTLIGRKHRVPKAQQRLHVSVIAEPWEKPS